MPPAVAYYRISTERQRRSGLGIEAQQAAVTRFTQAAGFSLVAEFVEAASSKGAERWSDDRSSPEHWHQPAPNTAR